MNIFWQTFWWILAGVILLAFIVLKFIADEEFEKNKEEYLKLLEKDDPEKTKPS
jgi:hypothetical protein